MSDQEQSTPAQNSGPADTEEFAAFAEAFGAFDDAEDRDDQAATQEIPREQPESPGEGVAPVQDGHAPTPADGDEEKSPEDLEELRKKAHGYESMMGRLRKEQEERRKLEEALARVRQQEQEQQRLAQQRPVQPQHSQPLPMAEIPAELKDEADKFSSEYPELVPLLRFPGKEGQKLRKLLQEYGPDVAATHGNSVMAQYKLAVTEQQMRQQFSQYDQRVQQQQHEMQQRFENERRNSHYSSIYEAVPEYGSMATDPSRRADLETYHAHLSDWVDGKPHREAQQLLHILRQGDAQSVVQVLRQFNSEQSTGRNHVDQNARRQAAHAAAAIPSRASAPPRGKPDPNDVRSAFKDAFGA